MVVVVTMKEECSKIATIENLLDNNDMSTFLLCSVVNIAY